MRKQINMVLLRKLWISRISDKEIVERMGHHRGVLRRAATRIGLMPRRKYWGVKNA